MTKVKVVDRVRLSSRYVALHANSEHVAEFCDSLGTVITKDADIEHWPEVQVRWDEGLRYLYDPKDLEVIT